MKVGYFFTSFPELDDSGEPKEFVGGAAVVAYHLAQQMDQLGHEVIVFTTSKNRQGHACNSPFTVRYYSAIASVGNANLSISGGIKPILHDCDIVHIHAPSPPMDAVGILYARIRNIPVVVTYHAEPEAMGYGSLARRTGIRLYNRAVGNILSNADALVSPTEGFIEKSRLSSHRERVHVVPNGIQVDELTADCESEESKRRIDIDPDRPTILYLNALVPQKGPDVLIRAMADITDTLPDALLIIAGSGPKQADLQRYAESKGLNNNVRFDGFVQEEIKPHYYNAANVFVLPSVENHESFGLTNLEAMVNGTPVIGTDVGGVRDVVEHGQTGYIVPHAEPVSLAERILDLLESPGELKRMSDAARRTAQARKYEWQTIAEQIQEIYQDLAGHK